MPLSDISYNFGYIFAGCNLLAAFIVIFFLYESGGLSLEAIDRMYNDPSIKPWNSRRLANSAEFQQSMDEAQLNDEKKSAEAPREQWREHGTGTGSASSSSERTV